MKIRNGFVSNSSSSSFAISLTDLSKNQIEKIFNHAKIGKELGIEWASTDYWKIESDENNIYGFTIMDNFDMKLFLKEIGVLDEAIVWDRDDTQKNFF